MQIMFNFEYATNPANNILKHPGLKKTRWGKTFRFLLPAMLCLCNGTALAQYNFNANCIEAYKEIIALDFSKGKQILENEKTIHPENKIPVLLDNYIDFLTLAIGADKSDLEKLKPIRSHRINMLAEGNADSPWHYHCLATVYLQWAFIRVKSGEYALAALDLNNAYRLQEKNKNLFPGFVPDLLLSGVTNTLIGSVPENYKWAVKLIGMEGTIETGREEIYKLIDIADNNPEWSHLASEAFFYLSFIEINLQSNKQNAARLLHRMETTAELVDSPLNCYIKSNLSMRIGKNDHAIQILENCNIRHGSYPFHYLEFILGNAKLYRLDQSAARHFLYYVNHYGGSDYVKSAYQRLAWISLIEGDQNGYRFYLSKIPALDKSFVDEDKHADAEAASKQIPDIRLLKARLLFDGGYYERAIGVLDAYPDSTCGVGKKDSVEFYYRKARIYHEWGKVQRAIGYYEHTIHLGASLPSYYAGNAALQMGLIYEDQHDYVSAVYYYDLCLGMRFTEYRSSIRQKAIIGKQRIAAKKKPAE
jgi:hypothetical protein